VKYSEAERELRKAGCFFIGYRDGHPLWYSPITHKSFKLGHHRSQEIRTGTAKKIEIESGVKLK
jgi:hypothetical protein